MPRGKKARTDEGEKKETKTKAKEAKPEPVVVEEEKGRKRKAKEPKPEPVVVEEEKKKDTTPSEISAFLKDHSGDMETVNAFKEQILNSSLSRKLVNSVMTQIWEQVESDPTHLAWGKACINVLFQDILDPKTRIKEAFFFPSEASEKRLLHFLNRAEKSLIVAVFTLTNDDLANAIRRARDRGVTIRIISDDDLMRMSGSDIRNLHDEGIQVRVDLDPHAQMHHKFCVIDDYILITGSFNWTKQAVGKNQENLVVMDDPVLARMYTDEFNRMWETFAPSVDRYLGGAKVVPPAQPAQTVEVVQTVQQVEPAPPEPENQNA